MYRFLIIVAALWLALVTRPAYAQESDIASASDGETSCARDGTDQIAEYALSAGTNLAKSINTRLTPKDGNPIAGRDLMVQPTRGNCTTCHAVADIRKKARTSDSTSVTRFGLQGTIGPALDGVADKYTEGELRLLVVDPQTALPKANSIMPAYHHVANRKRVRKECIGHAILTAQEVEDVVAYLLTLKDASK